MNDTVPDMVLAILAFALVVMSYKALLLFMADIGFERTVLLALAALLTLSFLVTARVLDK